MANITVTNSKTVALNDIKALVLKHHERCARVALNRNRGLIRDSEAVDEMVAANIELEIGLAVLLGVRKWDVIDS